MELLDRGSVERFRELLRDSGIYATEWVRTLDDFDEPPVLLTPALRRLTRAWTDQQYCVTMLGCALDIASTYVRDIQRMDLGRPVVISVSVSQWDPDGGRARPEFCLLVDPTQRRPSCRFVPPHTRAGLRAVRWLAQLPAAARDGVVVLEAEGEPSDWYLHRVNLVPAGGVGL